MYSCTCSFNCAEDLHNQRIRVETEVSSNVPVSAEKGAVALDAINSNLKIKMPLKDSKNLFRLLMYLCKILICGLVAIIVDPLFNIDDQGLTIHLSL